MATTVPRVRLKVLRATGVGSGAAATSAAAVSADAVDPCECFKQP
jgi:hypothetical protein